MGDLPTVTVTNNTFDNWGQATSRMKPDVAARITLDGNTVNAIGGAIAEVTAGTQTVSGSWNPAAGIYRVLGAVEIQGPADPTLTVDPNMEARFANFAYLQAGLSDDGGLMVLGTMGNEVLFTAGAASPARGQWYGVFLGANALPSTIQHTQIEWAGRFTGGYDSIRQTAGSLTLDNVTITEGNGPGVQVQGGTLTLTDSTFSNLSTVGGNPGAAVQAGATTGSNINVSGCTVSSTDGTAVHLANDADITATIDANPSLNGITILGDLPSVTVTNNTFDGWGLVTSRMKPDVAARITFDGNTVNAIGGAIAEVTAGTQTVSGTWSPVAAGIHRVLGGIEIYGPADPHADHRSRARRFDSRTLALPAGRPQRRRLVDGCWARRATRSCSPRTHPLPYVASGMACSSAPMRCPVRSSTRRSSGPGGFTGGYELHPSNDRVVDPGQRHDHSRATGIRSAGPGRYADAGRLHLLGNLSTVGGNTGHRRVQAGATTGEQHQRLGMHGQQHGRDTPFHLANDADITATIDANPSLNGIVDPGRPAQR